MSRTCPNCDKNLPAGVELATCPFCFKNLLVVPPANENQPFGRTLNEDDLEVDLSPVEGVPELTLDLDVGTGEPFG